MAILGEMGEMGDEAPRMHELVGAYAAAEKLDMLACVVVSWPSLWPVPRA